MKRIINILIVAVLSVTSMACTESVPAGHMGRTWEPGGFTNELLKPGRHECYNRCKMYLMESTDQTFQIPMQVLCADNLNFSFTIDVLVGVNKENKRAVLSAFQNLKPAGPYLFTVQQLFDTYIKPVADQEARKIVSSYRTEELVSKRPEVIEKVRAAVTKATNAAILKVKRVTVGNLDFPKVLTDAQVQKAKRKIEIETARAEGEKRAAKAEADLKLAKINAQRGLFEAQGIADANKILAASISPQYLAYKQILALEKAADGENNMFMYPYTDVVNRGIDTSKWLTSQGIMDAELIARINEAKAKVKKGTKTKNTPGKAKVAKPNKKKRK